jgi:hypothetical protein
MRIVEQYHFHRNSAILIVQIIAISFLKHGGETQRLQWRKKVIKILVQDPTQ